jgi:nucleoside-diphosphate-sugar epimerase
MLRPNSEERHQSGDFGVQMHERREIIVTGAAGFVGRRLSSVLDETGEHVIRISRSAGQSVGEINSSTDWIPILRKGVTVVHLAARAHVLDVSSANDLAAFREVNTAGTKRLAIACAEAGARRLVFLSSVRVLGANTNGRPPFTVNDAPNPGEAYAVSKHEAEQALHAVSADTGLEVCIIRPTLVYGPGAAGNFERLVRWVRRGVPLPLGAVRNARSLIGLDNLVDLIRVCTTHPEAVGKTFLASDGVSISTPELVTGIAHAMRKRPRLIPVPVGMLRLAGKALDRGAEIDRLVGSLEVDIAETCRTLGWAPPIDMHEGLRRAVAE